MKTKKEKYEKPSIVVVELDGEGAILADSGVQGTRQDYGHDNNCDWGQDY